jgi:hypothetical protein
MKHPSQFMLLDHPTNRRCIPCSTEREKFRNPRQNQLYWTIRHTSARVSRGGRADGLDPSGPQYEHNKSNAELLKGVRALRIQSSSITRICIILNNTEYIIEAVLISISFASSLSVLQKTHRELCTSRLCIVQNPSSLCLFSISAVFTFVWDSVNIFGFQNVSIDRNVWRTLVYWDPSKQGRRVGAGSHSGGTWFGSRPESATLNEVFHVFHPFPSAEFGLVPKIDKEHLSPSPFRWKTITGSIVASLSLLGEWQQKK